LKLHRKALIRVEGPGNDAEEAGFSDKLIYEEIALDPVKRKVSFIKVNDTGGKEVFRKWNGMEDKIPY